MNHDHFYIDIHAIQTVPPSCVNRDDTGSPKTAVYGGSLRARVSSQSWKRAIRLMFMETFEKNKVGLRTKRIVPLVAEEIEKLNPDLNAEKAAIKALENAGLKIKGTEKGTDALFFISQAQVEALARLAAEENPDKKAYKQALMSEPSVDMALFGRMVASDPSLNYDAAAQVAHSISTHTVHNEYDYFTAVDDCMPENNAGAAHLGSVEYNSSTLYRYATVNIHELAKHLGVDTASTVRGFLEAFVRSMPDGKQNTFANRTLPDAIYVTVRRDQPVNLCGAFEKPVNSKEGFVEASKNRLAEYAQKVYRQYAAEPDVALAVGDGLESIAQEMPLQDLLSAIEDTVRQYEAKREERK